MGDPDAPKPASDADSSETGVQLPEGVQLSKDNGAPEGAPKDGAAERGDNGEGANEDVVASTDSSVAGSDEEAET